MSKASEHAARWREVQDKRPSFSRQAGAPRGAFVMPDGTVEITPQPWNQDEGLALARWLIETLSDDPVAWLCSQWHVTPESP